MVSDVVEFDTFTLLIIVAVDHEVFDACDGEMPEGTLAVVAGRPYRHAFEGGMLGLWVSSMSRSGTSKVMAPSLGSRAIGRGVREPLCSDP